MSKFRYYATKGAGQAPVPAKAVHTNFLTHKEVAERTGIRLENAGKMTHQRLNKFHRNIRFPKVIFHKTLEAAPHLGYVHVTASKTDFAGHKDVTWGFYIANFSAEIGGETDAGQVAGSNADSVDSAGAEHFFHHISPGYSRMYFAVAMKNGEEAAPLQQVINREIGDNGVLFRTAAPMTALKNVLMLGAKNAELRKIVEAIG